MRARSLLSLFMVAALSQAACTSGDGAGQAPDAAVTAPDAGPAADAPEADGPDVGPLGEAFVDLLVAGEYLQAFERFDNTMKAAMPVPRLEAVWKQVIAQAGDFQKRIGVMTTRHKAFRIALVSCRFERADLTVKVVFFGEQVSGLFFLPAAADTKAVAAQAEGFVDLLAAGRFAEAHKQFDPTMKQALPVDKLEHTWTSVFARNGRFKTRLSTKTSREGKYDIALVDCQFDLANVTVKVVYDGGSISGLFFFPQKGAQEEYQAPAYARESTIEEKQVEFGAAMYRLPGTLTLPKNPKGKVPALVLVHGSGPQDRDETIGPNKPFRDLALGLASKGVAVLRYDKRTRIYAERMASLKHEITVRAETVQDAALAAKFVSKMPQIDPKRVYIAGHSLGGMLIPRIADLAQEATGFLVLAGNARPLEDLIVEQYEYIFGLDGAYDDFEKGEIERVRKQSALVKARELTVDTPAEDLPLGVPAAYWLDLRNYRPAQAANRIKKPLRILQGGRDYQVTTTDFEVWKKALADKPNVSFKLFPALNHLFMTGQGKSQPSEYNKPDHVAEEVIDDIAAFVKAGP